MVQLQVMHAESVSLTRQEGKPKFLDGNKLYFEYQLRGSKGKVVTAYGCVDLSVTRKTFTPIQASDFPTVPQPREVRVDWEQIAFSLWLQYNSVYYNGEYPTNQKVCWGRFEAYLSAISYSTFVKILETDREGRVVSKEIIDMAKSVAEEKRAYSYRKVNANFKPMRKLSEAETVIVMSIFNFDGDKKGLVTALKTSLGVEFKDSEVVVDKLLTKKIIMPKTVEELI